MGNRTVARKGLGRGGRFSTGVIWWDWKQAPSSDEPDKGGAFPSGVFGWCGKRDPNSDGLGKGVSVFRWGYLVVVGGQEYGSEGLEKASTVRSAAKRPTLLPNSPSTVRSAAKRPILLPAIRPSMSFAEACGVEEGKYHLLSVLVVASVRKTRRNPYERTIYTNPPEIRPTRLWKEFGGGIPE